jgi:hypothetical protein
LFDDDLNAIAYRKVSYYSDSANQKMMFDFLMKIAARLLYTTTGKECIGTLK